MDNTIIVIPTYEPDDRILELVASIHLDMSLANPIIVVDDGSGDEFKVYFEKLERQFGCIVLRHYVNLGKGRALKTAMNHILNTFPHVLGMVTLDSDGQHTVQDMATCLNAFNQNHDALVLGVRDFVNQVPVKSKFGNVMTRNVLGMFTGIKLNDTQTGLRVIPRQYMEQLMTIKGERFEFEMNMIISSSENHIPIIEVPIETIYYDGNASTHFRALADSVSIYGAFLKYMMSSISSSLIDVAAFWMFLNVLHFNEDLNIILASFIGRLISSMYNYFVNRKIVFKSKGNHSLFKYYILVFVQISVSSMLLTLIRMLFVDTDITFLKVIVDGVLFFVSFHIQKRFVFNKY